MPMPKVKGLFGVKYLIPYDITTLKPLAVLRAIGEISFENPSEAVKLVGGHADAPYDVEYGQPEPVLSGTVREYPTELFQLLESCTVTESAAQVSGGFDASPTNAQGTSIIKSANGVATITVTTAASLIFGRYTFVATGAQTLDLHIAGLTDSFSDINGKVVTGITCSTTGTVAVTGTGVSLSVVGTPAFTVGDTCYVDVRPINTGSTKILVGTGTVPASFGVRCILPRKSDGVLYYIDIFNVTARGMSWGAVSREFSENEISWNVLARASDGAVYEVVRVLGS